MLQARYLRDTGSITLPKHIYQKFKTMRMLGKPIIRLTMSQEEVYCRANPEDDIRIILRDEGIAKAEKFYEAHTGNYIIKLTMHPPGA